MLSVDTVTRIRLDAPYEQQSWTQPSLTNSVIAYGRPQGHPVLVSPAGLYEVTGEEIPHSQWHGQLSNLLPVVSVQGDRICGRGDYTRPDIMECRAISFSRVPSPGIRTKSLGTDNRNGFAIHQIALNSSGSRVYLNTAFAPAIVAYNVDLGLQMAGFLSAATPSFVAVDADDAVYGNQTSYNADLSSRGPVSVTAAPGHFWVSGDTAVLLSVDSGDLTFTRNY